MIHLTKIDPTSGKTVPFSKEDYPKVNNYLVVSEEIMRQLIDPFCEKNPEICNQIFEINK